MTGLGSQRHLSRPNQCLSESRQHREVGVKRDFLQASHAQRGKAVVELQVAKRTLHGSAATVEVAEPLRVSGECAERVVRPSVSGRAG